MVLEKKGDYEVLLGRTGGLQRFNRDSRGFNRFDGIIGNGTGMIRISINLYESR